MKKVLDDEYGRIVNTSNRQMFANDISAARKATEELLPGYAVEAILPMSVITTVMRNNLTIRLMNGEMKIPPLKQNVVNLDWKDKIGSLFTKKTEQPVISEIDPTNYFVNNTAIGGEQGDIFELEGINPGTREIISVLGRAAASNQAIDCYVITHAILLRISGKKLKDTPEVADVDHPLVCLIVPGISQRMAVIYKGYSTPINLTRIIGDLLESDRPNIAISMILQQLTKIGLTNLAQKLEEVKKLHDIFINVLGDKFYTDESTYTRGKNTSDMLLNTCITFMLEILNHNYVGLKPNEVDLKNLEDMMDITCKKYIDTSTSLEKNVQLSESFYEMHRVLDYYKSQSKNLQKKIN